MFSGKKLSCITLATLLLLMACSKDDPTSPQAEPPVLPPSTSFVMDFDDFDAGANALLKSLSDQPLLIDAKGNWLYAAANVWAWQTTIFVTLAVPVYSFQAALLHDRVPSFENGDWVWSYDFNVLAGRYNAELHGRIVASGIEWEMYISREGSFDHFLWYTGESDILATGGTWTLHKSPQEDVPMLDIQWHRNPDDLTWDLKYTNILQGTDEYGSYIYNGIIADDSYDAFFDIYGVKDDILTNIKWHRINKNGRIKNTVHFGDDAWHCWDELGDDADCGE